MNKILLKDYFNFLINKTIVSVALYLFVLQLLGNYNFVSLYLIVLLMFAKITYTVYLKMKYRSQINYLITVQLSCTKLNLFQQKLRVKKSQIPFNF